MCDNILALLPYMYAIYTMQELSADPNYDSKENKSWWDWGTFWKGLSWVLTAIAAISVSVAMFGAATPLLLGIIAGITLGAGILTGINGIATMIEAGTSYNFVRDTIFIGNENAFNIYGGIVGGIATVGTIICGIYQLTSPIKGFTKHGLERTLAREGHGVNARAMQETVRKPLEIVTQSNGGIKFIGKNAVVVLNEVGKVITTWAKNSSAWRYLILLCLGYSLTEEN